MLSQHFFNQSLKRQTACFSSSSSKLSSQRVSLALRSEPKARVLFLSGPQSLSRDFVVAVLERRGHTVDSMEVTPQALASSARYDLIVLEIDESDPDAFTLCMQIRKFSKAPLLLLVPPTSRVQGLRGLELGADGFVVTPVDRRELAARSEAMIRRYRYG